MGKRDPDQAQLLPIRSLAAMPELKNARHERFAQEVAKGRPRREAYVTAGYKDSPGRAPDVGAHHLLTNPNIRARVAELQQRGAERAEITLESLIREAAELQALAAAAKQYSAANGALKLKAELSGHYMQRKESTVKHAETDWSTDELVAWLANFEASIQRNEEADSGGEVCACATRT
jgi:hypothetical protein